MNVTLLNIIADESVANIKAGTVVAFRREGDSAWHDPWGGSFSEREQAQLNDLAFGDCDYVCLDGVNGTYRAFAAHLTCKF